MGSDFIHETKTSSRACILREAQRLFLSKGYEATTVQDIMEACRIAKGTLYHHFSHKLAILEELTEGLVEESIQIYRNLAADSNLSALEKLVAVFQKNIAIKPEMVELSVTILRTLFSEENLRWRYRITKTFLSRVLDFLTQIIQQGRNEGILKCSSASEAALIIAELSQNMKERISQILIDPDQVPEPSRVIRRLIAAYSDAMEKILGSEPGLLSLEKSASIQAMLKAIEHYFKHKEEMHDRNP